MAPNLANGKSKANWAATPSTLSLSTRFKFNLRLDTSFPDKTRGVFNEGGLYGERAGWHLPGFNTASWTSRSLNQGLPGGKAGVGFFRTEFNLNIPKGRDVHLSFVVGGPKGPYRATLFVNGWTMGRIVSNMGPQYKFPVHEGILNYQGKKYALGILMDLSHRLT